MNTEALVEDALPTYGKAPSRPGLYLGLFHGREDPRQRMDDWGFNGPMIGPLQWFHTTYNCTLRIAFESEADGPRWPPQTAPLLAGQTAPGRTVGWELYGRDGDA